jgi:hypothetical protein
MVIVILIPGKATCVYMVVAVSHRALQENDYGLHNRDAVPRVPVFYVSFYRASQNMRVMNQT